jgi:hypothetical protein
VDREYDCHFWELREAFLTWRNALQGHQSSTESIDFEHLYGIMFEDTKFGYLKRKRRPHFNQKSYPSLFDEFEVFDKLANPSWAGLPKSWSLEEINGALKRSSFARLLLAFIWKQGDFLTFEGLLSGLQDSLESGKSSAVMHQFGRHLKDPLNSPIFDQHTSRHRLLYDVVGECKTYLEFKALFGKSRIPTSEAGLNNRSQCKAYLEWWKKELLPALPPGLHSDWRSIAILWSDRIMFSLGKAAKGLYEWKSEEDRRKEKPGKRKKTTPT